MHRKPVANSHDYGRRAKFYFFKASTVITKPLLIALLLALVGCGAAPKIPAQPEEQPKAQEAEPQADNSESPPLGFRQYRIVEAATTGNVIRLHSPGGWRIELPAGNAPWLADILRQLP